MSNKTKTNSKNIYFSYQNFLPIFQILILLAVLSSFFWTGSLQVQARTRTTAISKCVLEMTRMNWKKDCSLAKFDSRLGKLKTVKLTGSAATENLWLVENLNIEAQPIELEVKNTRVVLQGPTPTTNLMIINLPLVNKTVDFGANDGFQDSNGLAGNSYDGVTPNIDDDNKIYPKLTAEAVISQDLSDTTSLATFSGSTAGEIVIIPVTASNLSGCNSSGNVVCRIETFGSAEIGVVYEYEDYDVAVNIVGFGPDFILPIIVPDVNYPLTVRITNKDSEPTPPGTKATLTLPPGVEFDISTFSLADWTVTRVFDEINGTTLVTFTKTEAMTASQIIDLPIIIKASSKAPNSIKIDVKAIVNGVDFLPSDNQSTRNLEKDLPPILSTTTGSFVNTGIFRTPLGFLGGKDTNTLDSVKNFVIKSLPNSAAGILYLDAAGTIPVSLNQELTPNQASNLFFKPVVGFVGSVSFNFSAKDSFDLVNPVPISAVLTITANNPSNNSTFFAGGVGSLVNNSGGVNNSQPNQNISDQNPEPKNQQNQEKIDNPNQKTLQNETQSVNQNNPVNKIIISFQNKTGENIEIKVDSNGTLQLSSNIDQKALFRTLRSGQIAKDLQENGIIAIEENGQIRLIYRQNNKVLGIDEYIYENNLLKNNQNTSVISSKIIDEKVIQKTQNQNSKTLEIKTENDSLIRTGGIDNSNKILGILIILLGFSLFIVFFKKKTTQNYILEDSANMKNSNPKIGSINKPLR